MPQMQLLFQQYNTGRMPSATSRQSPLLAAYLGRAVRKEAHPALALAAISAHLRVVTA